MCKGNWAMAGASKVGLGSVHSRIEEEDEDDKGILAIGTMGVGLAGIESKLLAQIDSLECDKEVTLEDVHKLQAELQKVLYISDQITKFKTGHLSSNHASLSTPPPFIPAPCNYNEPLVEERENEKEKEREKEKEKEKEKVEEDQRAKEGLFPLQEFLENPLNPSPRSLLAISAAAKKITTPAKSKLGLCFCSQPATTDFDDDVVLSQQLTRKSLSLPSPPTPKREPSSTKWWANIFRKKGDSGHAAATTNTTSDKHKRKTKEKQMQQVFCSRSGSIGSSSSAISSTDRRRNSDSSSVSISSNSSTSSNVLESLIVEQSAEAGMNQMKYKKMQGRLSTNPETEYWIKTDDDYVVLEL